MRFRALELIVNAGMYLRIVEQDMKLGFLTDEIEMIRTVTIDAVTIMQT